MSETIPDAQLLDDEDFSALDAVGAFLGGGWSAGLQQATWRGVPFVCSTDSVDAGRMVAVHEYPYRESQPAWPEDTGRMPRRFPLTGYLVGDDVLVQRETMLRAVETPGPGTLVHPSFGAMQVSVLRFASSMRADLGRATELVFEFIEAGQQDYPSAEDDTGVAVDADADEADAAAEDAADDGPLAQFAAAVGDVIDDVVAAVGDVIDAVVDVVADVAEAVGDVVDEVLGVFDDVADLILPVVSIVTGTVIEIVARVAPILNLVDAIVSDAASTVAAAYSVDGAFGRYAETLPLALRPASVADALEATTARRSAALTALDDVAAAASPLDLAVALRQAVAVVSTGVSPTDRLRVLQRLAVVPGTDLAALCCRRFAVIALARAARAYQPKSYDDAIATLDVVARAIENEATVAGDMGDDAGFATLRQLQGSVIRDLRARGASLAPLITVAFAETLPALVMAHRLYGDATRADEIVARVDPVHPGFMPRSVTVAAR